jgi:hypothetical protein
LVTTTDAENIDNMPEPLGGPSEGEGKQKRKRMANSLYKLEDFARHWDNEASDIE